MGSSNARTRETRADGERVPDEPRDTVESGIGLAISEPGVLMKQTHLARCPLRALKCGVPTNDS
jgi:hypothetical protein